MNRYELIQTEFHKKYNRTCKTCWIAQVKRELGYKMKHSWNWSGSYKFPVSNKDKRRLKPPIKKYF